jgi:hypothetical protein
VGALVSIAFPKTSISAESINSIDTVPVGELYDGEDLMMNFRSPKDSLTGISLKVSTYGRDVSGGMLIISLLDEDETVLFSEEVSGQSIKDQAQLAFRLPQIANSKDKDYSVHINTNGVEKNNALTFMANDNIIDGVSTTMNGVPCANMVFTLEYVITVPYYNLRYAFDLILITASLWVLTVAAFGRNRLPTDPSEK